MASLQKFCKGFLTKILKEFGEELEAKEFRKPVGTIRPVLAVPPKLHSPKSPEGQTPSLSLLPVSSAPRAKEDSPLARWGALAALGSRAAGGGQPLLLLTSWCVGEGAAPRPSWPVGRLGQRGAAPFKSQRGRLTASPRTADADPRTPATEPGRGFMGAAIWFEGWSNKQSALGLPLMSPNTLRCLLFYSECAKLQCLQVSCSQALSNDAVLITDCKPQT